MIGHFITIQLVAYSFTLLFIASTISIDNEEAELSQYKSSSAAIEICSKEANRCQFVGSAGPWLLSIIETAIEPCGSSDGGSKIAHWLNEYDWLLEQVRVMDQEYDYLLKMQAEEFWTVSDFYRQKQCNEVITLLQNEHPLNDSMR
ncbi:hypothetical protein CWE08_11400 [Aliidiomarina iranensis]|uniref:Uncharacterized protein n=1 Tax=Aliidiomarina iranensis TaxID=1434071 RepID=A0A432VQP5_9GAMM|nr:hypothetical protein [Aliidiomarina iranensis]RUO18515.1 hypothetical protein CWE08_11400 [Aliidiomarina iranensis]